MVASKYFAFWREILKHVIHRKEAKLVPGSRFDGKTYGVDMNTWILSDNQYFREVAFAIGWRNTQYSPVRMMDMIMRRHRRLLKAKVNPLYVFPGRDNPKRLFRPKEKKALNAMQDFYEEAQKFQIQSSERQKKLCSNFQMTQTVHPDLIRFLGQWMKDTMGVNVIQAPFETCWQLLELERTGQTDGTISNDATIAMAGAETMLVQTKYAKKVSTRLFLAERDLRQQRYQHDFRGMDQYLPEAMTFYGNDFWHRTEHSSKEAIRTHFMNFVIDQQEGKPINPIFKMAADQLRYGPVVRKRDEGYVLEPLNPLPADTSWVDAIGFDPKEHLSEISDLGEAMMLQNGQNFTNPESPYPWFQGLHCVMPPPTDEPIDPEIQSDASSDDQSLSDKESDESEDESESKT